MNKVTILLLLFILTSSPVLATPTFGEFSTLENVESQTSLIGSYEKTGTVEEHSIIKISVADGLGVDSSKSSTEQQNQQKSTVTTTKRLSIKAFDSLGVFDGDKKYLDDVKQDSDRKASMERIWNSERIRFNGKNLVNTSMLENSQTIFGEPFEFGLNGQNSRRRR